MMQVPTFGSFLKATMVSMARNDVSSLPYFFIKAVMVPNKVVSKILRSNILTINFVIADFTHKFIFAYEIYYWSLFPLGALVSPYFFPGSAKENPVVTPLMEYVRQKRAAESGAQVLMSCHLWSSILKKMLFTCCIVWQNGLFCVCDVIRLSSLFT